MESTTVEETLTRRTKDDQMWGKEVNYRRLTVCERDLFFIRM